MGHFVPNHPVGLTKRILILMKIAVVVESDGTTQNLKFLVSRSSSLGAVAHRILICLAKMSMIAFLLALISQEVYILSQLTLWIR